MSKLKLSHPSVSAIEDLWQRRATAAAIEAARTIVFGGDFPPGTPVGQLSDVQWGWLVAAILFGWISAKAEQATAEQLDTERVVRMTGLDPIRWTPARLQRFFRSSLTCPAWTGRRRSPTGRARPWSISCWLRCGWCGAARSRATSAPAA